jgi:anthranilate/para-aminobenzoate synthase component I
MTPNWPTPGHEPTRQGAWRSAKALAAHVRVLLGLPPGAHPRPVIRTAVELPEHWWIDPEALAHRPLLSFRAPGRRWHTGLGEAMRCPIELLRYEAHPDRPGELRPHPSDVAAAQQWVDSLQVSCPAAVVAGFPTRQADGQWAAPLHLWLPRLWLIDGPAWEVAIVMDHLGTRQELAAEVEALLAAIRSEPQPAPPPLTLAGESEADVAQALQMLADPAQGLEKVVLGWPRDWRGGAQEPQVWRHLREHRSDAWCSIAKVGEFHFFCASPELLVQASEGGLRSLALAGTPTHPAGATLAGLEGSVMAIEHSVVVDYIARNLKDLGLSPRHEPPSLRPAGPLMHWATSVEVSHRGEVGALTAAMHLHPTPALLGLPRATALEALSQLEASPRGWYGGFAGLLAGDGSGDGELAVLLRGAQRQSHGWHAWAGAGLVAGGDPLGERQEIMNKHKALAEGLGLSGATA